MPTHYEIRQQVGTVKSKWLEVINKGRTSEAIERIAKKEYQALVKGHPKEYFELVKVTRDEECLAFTPKFD